MEDNTDDNKCKAQSHLESISIKEYFERILQEFRRASEDALKIRTVETERRLDLLNNHAERVDEILDRCLPRTEWDIHHNQLKEKVTELEKFKIVMDTKASQASVNWSFAFSAVVAILAIVSLLHEFTK